MTGCAVGMRVVMILSWVQASVLWGIGNRSGRLECIPEIISPGPDSAEPTPW